MVDFRKGKKILNLSAMLESHKHTAKKGKAGREKNPGREKDAAGKRSSTPQLFRRLRQAAVRHAGRDFYFLNLDEKKRVPAFVGMSLIVHAILVLAVLLVYMIKSTEEHEIATLQLYMGAGNKPTEGRAESGEGSKEGQQNSSEPASEETGLNASDAYGENVDWGTGTDPTLEGGSRYNANLIVDVSPNDYPASARRAAIGDVVVAVTLYISGSNSRIRRVKIRYVRSNGNVHKPFEQAFIDSSLKILLQKTRLANLPYSENGKPRDFVWDTKITFTLK